MKFNYAVRYIVIFFTLIGLGACSSDPEKYKGVYDKNEDVSALDVPPDMTFPTTTQSFEVPQIASDRATYSAYTAKGDTSLVLPTGSNKVKFVRDGAVAWLEISAKPEEIWGDVIAFFKDIGFSFTKEEPVLGLMETVWLENRVDVPTGWFAGLLGALHSAGKMDRYRIRLERKADNENVTLLFIAHQGLKESVYGDYSVTDVTEVWEPRDSDPDLETEMLVRFLVFKGMETRYAKALVTGKKHVDRTKINTTNDNYNLLVKENFARTWRRMGIAMDRMGVLVEDKNRSAGLFYIKLTEDFVNTEDKNWLEKIFSSEEEVVVEQYRLSVEDLGESSLIIVLDKTGKRINDHNALYILTNLQEYLR